MPSRSRGCRSCVRRKIRCDGRRDGGCKRCETYGVQCPGYSTEIGFTFKDQTVHTKNEAVKNYARIEHRSSVSRISRHADLLLQAASPCAGVISSASAQRAALHQEFILSYLPRQSGRLTSSPNPLSFLEILASHTPAYQNSSLQPALDALGLVQLGSIAKDQRLLKSSVGLYGKALGRLAFDLRREDLQRSDDVLASTIVLSTCELYEEIAQNNGGWVKHIDGTNQLMKVRGARMFKSDLSLALYANARNNALIQGLISREASYMETPEWRNVGKRCLPTGAAFSSLFYDLAILVPGMLERTDVLCSKDIVETDAIADLIRQLTTLETKLERWFHAWELSSTAAGQPLRTLRPVGHFVNFTSHCPDRTCSRAYHFPSFHVGYLHSLYWMCMHSLRSSLQQVCRLGCKLYPEWSDRTHHEVGEDGLLQYVLDLCRCMPFFCEPLSGSIGHIAIFLPMRIAATYFGPRGHLQWLKWIGSVKATVFTQGLSPPIVGRRVFPPNWPGPPPSSSPVSPGQVYGEACQSSTSSSGG